MNSWYGVAGWYAFASAVTLAIFAWDKLAAKAGRKRIPEKSLHLLEVVGGWPGAIAAILWVRHKSNKPAFLLITFAIMALHIAAWGAWLIR